MRLFSGEIPEYIPRYNYFTPGDQNPANLQVMPMPKRDPNAAPFGKDGFVNMFGVKYVTSASTGYAGLPEPGNFILKDIRDWKKVIKTPDISDVSESAWEDMAKKDMERMKLNREMTALALGPGGGVFQDLMSFMGFTEGLCAMAEEPDEVKELFDYLTDYYAEICKKGIRYYKPDFIQMVDDNASKLQPFISLATFKDELLPFYDKVMAPAREAGIPGQMHDCGRCEEFMDDYYAIGIRAWDPAQTTNDLDAFKKKWGRKFAFLGGWDWNPPESYPEVDEEWVRQTVRDCIDRYAPGGGFGWSAGVVAADGDTAGMTVNKWLQDEVVKYGENFYA